MRQFKLIVVLPIILITYFAGCDNSYSDHPINDQLYRYLEQLGGDPNNCFLLDQIAAIYQEKYQLDNAIQYYETTVKECPEDAIARFQLGVTYYLKLNKEKAIKFMNSAIGVAENSGDLPLAESLRAERKSWLEKWNKVQKWYKEKNPQGSESNHTPPPPYNH